jgi:hypothetical protein
MSGGPGASSLFPSGQEQQNHQPHWGVYANAASLPNAAGNVLVAGKFENLAVGHLAYSTADAATYQCTSVGTVGGGDATWTPTAGGGGGPTLNWVFVAKNGVDSPAADGSISKPYLTIVYALAQIPTIGPTAPSPTNRWCVFVAAGRYNEVATIKLRANVMIFGSHFMATRIAAPAWGLDASFTPAGDHRSGVQNAAISGLATFDFNAIASNEGKLYFQNVWLQSQVDFTAFSSIQQFFLDDVFTFANVNVNGGQLITRNSQFQAPLVFKVGPTLPSSVWIDDHSTYQVGRTLDLTGQGGETYDIQWYGSGDAGPTSVTGTVTVKATGDALPIKSQLTLAGGATLTRMTDAFGTGYTPVVPANWSPVPVEIAGALDQLAARRQILSGVGDPEGVVTAPPGSLYVSTTGGLNQTFFIKVSGVGNTGWDRIVMVDRSTGEVLIGQDVIDHGSNAGIQYTSAVANRAQLRENQYGPNNAAPGLSAFKSRGPIGGPDVGVIDGDPLWRMSCVGVSGDGTKIPLAGFITIQVPVGGVHPSYVSTEFELQLVALGPPIDGINGRRVVFKITSQGVPVLRETVYNPGPSQTDPAAGVATLDAAGQLVIANKNVKAGTRFTLTAQDGGTLPTGSMRVIARTVGVDFTIASSANAGDAGTIVYWQLWEGI